LGEPERRARTVEWDLDLLPGLQGDSEVERESFCDRKSKPGLVAYQIEQAGQGGAKILYASRAVNRMPVSRSVT
jgi:hypothetical protein